MRFWHWQMVGGGGLISSTLPPESSHEDAAKPEGQGATPSGAADGIEDKSVSAEKHDWPEPEQTPSHSQSGTSESEVPPEPDRSVAVSVGTSPEWSDLPWHTTAPDRTGALIPHSGASRAARAVDPTHQGAHPVASAKLTDKVPGADTLASGLVVAKVAASPVVAQEVSVRNTRESRASLSEADQKTGFSKVYVTSKRNPHGDSVAAIPTLPTSSELHIADRPAYRSGDDLARVSGTGHIAPHAPLTATMLETETSRSREIDPVNTHVGAETARTELRPSDVSVAQRKTNVLTQTSDGPIPAGEREPAVGHAVHWRAAPRSLPFVAAENNNDWSVHARQIKTSELPAAPVATRPAQVELRDRILSAMAPSTRENLQGGGVISVNFNGQEAGAQTQTAQPTSAYHEAALAGSAIPEFTKAPPKKTPVPRDALARAEGVKRASAYIAGSASGIATQAGVTISADGPRPAGPGGDMPFIGAFGVADGPAERAVSTLPAQMTETAPRPGPAAMVQQISRQVADAVPRIGDAALEITLHPEELGRLKLTLTTGEGAPVLHVLADRPETMDLIRRHIDLLMREFGAQGFAGLDVALGQDRRGQGHPPGDSTTAGPDASLTASEPLSHARPATSPGGGLDIRL